MEAPAEKGTSFDERAALEELERLQRQILWHQSQRRKAEAEFEDFVRSFKNGTAAPVPQDVPESACANGQPVPSDNAEPPGPIPPEPSVVSVPAEAVTPTAAPPSRSGTWWSRRRMAASAAAAAIIATGGLLAWTFRHRAPERPAATLIVTGAASRAAVPESRPTPAAQPARPHSELTAIRPVWIRVIVDGQRILEREVPAGTSLPLAPKRTLVVRAGDAGAVRLTVAGQDRGFLGREGEVVTRTFAVPPPAEQRR